MLELADWTVRRGGRIAAQVAELKVRRGEIVGLSGSNGAGKSSLLMSLLGARGAQGEGTLRWERAEVSSKDLIRRVGCAVLVDDRPDARDLTVTQWLRYHAAARGAPVEGPPEEAMKAMGLLSNAETRVAHLSGGLCERLLLARLLLAPAALVLIDHPLARLDAGGEFALSSLFERLRGDRKAAVLWAATDKRRLEGHCDRVEPLSAP